MNNVGALRLSGTSKLYVEEVKKIRESENAGKDLTVQPIHHH